LYAKAGRGLNSQFLETIRPRGIEDLLRKNPQNTSIPQALC